jgi:molybdopterin converting factor small subunit
VAPASCRLRVSLVYSIDISFGFGRFILALILTWRLRMAITIEIPTAFRRFTDGVPKLDSAASTITEALNDLTTRYPALSRHVRDEQGQIRQFLNVYLNEEDIRFLGGESVTLKDGDRVLLVPSIAGG